MHAGLFLPGTGHDRQVELLLRAQRGERVGDEFLRAAVGVVAGAHDGNVRAAGRGRHCVTVVRCVKCGKVLIGQASERNGGEITRGAQASNWPRHRDCVTKLGIVGSDLPVEDHGNSLRSTIAIH